MVYNVKLVIWIRKPKWQWTDERTNEQEKKLGFNYLTFFIFYKPMDLHGRVFLLLQRAI